MTPSRSDAEYLCEGTNEFPARRQPLFDFCLATRDSAASKGESRGEDCLMNHPRCKEAREKEVKSLCSCPMKPNSEHFDSCHWLDFPLETSSPILTPKADSNTITFNFPKFHILIDSSSLCGFRYPLMMASQSHLSST